MFDLSKLNLALAEHAARNERANQYGWMWEAARSTGDARPRSLAVVVSFARRHIGGLMVQLGELLQDAPTSHDVDPEAAR